jgi:transcriptional regulator with XRE-family HTH domain
MPPTRSYDKDAVRFGGIVNRLRMERRWTLRDVAKLCGMNATYLGLVERGENVPSLTTILRLGAVLGVPASELLAEVERAKYGAQAKKSPDGG